tara:strand:- start:70 stop:288 length:219 start_codon:yes stop_codon:yes gene_type:complete
MTEHSSHYYDYDRNDLSRKNPFTEIAIGDDGILNLPDEIMEKTGWKEGDELVWEDQGDGSFTLKKYVEEKDD